MSQTSNTEEQKHHHSSSGRHHHHHHRRKSSYQQKDSSSAMERRGENIIYNNVRKEKISLMIKRIVFCILSIILIAYTIYIMAGFDENSVGGTIMNKGYSNEEINEMKIKIIDLEDEIERLTTENENLKNELSQYDK